MMDSPLKPVAELELLTPLRFALRCWYALHLLVADTADLVVPRRPPHGYAVVPSHADEQAGDGYSTRSGYALEPRRLHGCGCSFCRLG
jgi:hypothetical protein